mmetsp:Transcript_30678/g.42480  ORF Transcript_30678/g.42480 Transcript_30678/m.42480 type:complete len:117 (+) Transcript_30678:370-720(+)
MVAWFSVSLMVKILKIFWRFVFFVMSLGTTKNRRSLMMFSGLFEEPRNVILGACSDGVKKFGLNSESMSVTVLSIFNLPSLIWRKFENLVVYGIQESKPSNYQLALGVLVDDLLEL